MSGLFGNSTTQQPSLFGNTGTQQQTGGGLFGSTSQTQQQSSGLFGSTVGTTGGSLFGSQPPRQQQSQQGGGSLFGAQNQQQTGTGGLFGASTQQQQQNGAQQATGGGLFGGNTQQQQAGGAPGSQLQPQNAPWSNAQPQQQQTQPGGSVFGGSTLVNNQSTTYFDSILENSRQRRLGEPGDEDLPRLQLGLGDLRQRMRKFNSGTTDPTAQGAAHYLLAASGVDPGAAVRDLQSLSATPARTDRPRAEDSVDTDVEGYLAGLQTQTTLNMIQDGLARSVRDFDTFLEDNVTMEWDAQRKRIYHHFGIKTAAPAASASRNGFAASESQNAKGGFGRSRRSKAANLAGSRTGQSPGTSNFGKSGLHKSIIGTTGSTGSGFQPLFADVQKRIETDGITVPDPHNRLTRERESRLATKISELNAVRLRRRCYPLLHELSKASNDVGEDHTEHIVKAYKALIEICGEPSEEVSPSDERAIKERKYSEAYLDVGQHSARRTDIRMRILRGSTRFLEKSFFESLELQLSKNPKEANLGGIPNVVSKVKAYVRLRAARKDLWPDLNDLHQIGEDKVWAVIFYLLRSGHVQEAVDYVNENSVAFRTIDRSFSSYLTDYCRSSERRLSRPLQDRINNEYNQRSRIAPEGSIDPYRMACYKIIGRCDIRNRTIEGVIVEMNDYIWLQFVLAREVNQTNEIASEVCNLQSVQATISEIGQRYFQKGENFGLFFYLRILSGFFEEAIAGLYPHAYPDAIHVAIALDYYGLLRVSDPELPEDNLLSRTTTNLPQIKFGQMVGLYTRDFRAANVTLAVDYLSLICLNKDLPHPLGDKQAKLCHEALRELVLESLEFAMLLGDISSDGQHIKGVIEERISLIALDDNDDFIRLMTIQAASIADDNGRATDAVLLYHLAGELNNALSVLSRFLGESISVPLGEEPLLLKPLKPRSIVNRQQTQDQLSSLSLTSVDDPGVLALNMLRLYQSVGMYKKKTTSKYTDELSILVKMSEAKKLVENQQWPQALEAIESLGILPLQARGDPSVIRGVASAFSLHTPPIATNVPNLLMWTLFCAKQQRQHLANQYGGNEGTRILMIDDLRQIVTDLMTFTSQLRYKFPSYVHEALARAQSD